MQNKLKKLGLSFLVLFCCGVHAATMTSSEFDRYCSDYFKQSKVIRDDLDKATNSKNLDEIYKQMCNMYLLNKEYLAVSKQNREYLKAEINIIETQKFVRDMLTVPAFNNEKFSLKNDC